MRIKKLLAAVLTLAMAFSLTAFADDGQTGGNDTGLELTKTATLENDGTYTIQLEAYATGATQTTHEKSGTPLDIVLVVDQSGSMAYNDNGRSTNNEADRRVTKLKDAVNSFVSGVSANAKEYEVDHKIALVGYASNRNGGQSSGISGIGYNGNSRYWVNTGLYVNGAFKNYAGDSNNSSLTNQDYQNALVSVNDVDGNVTSSITTSVNSFKASGGTYTEYGLEMAKKVLDNRTDKSRKAIIILFSDGETNSGINDVLTTANTLKGSSYNATIYSVGFATNASATNFLSYVSSNYTSSSYSDRRGYSGTQVAAKYSMTATNREELANIFNNITQDINNPVSNTTLNSSAVLKDIMSTGFDLPNNFTVSDEYITIKTVPGTYDEVTKSITWDESRAIENPQGITASFDTTNKEVDVTGFNYSDKFVGPGHDGEKLVVIIKGIEANGSALGDVKTNDEASGIYKDDQKETAPTDTFTPPQTMIGNKTFVLDYAKEAELEKVPATHLNADKMAQFTSTNNKLVESYGEVKVESGKVTYTPTKMNWNGYDTFYAFGTVDNVKQWSKVSVLPANNVYYEDTFVTSDSTGTVGIEYTGAWSTAGTVSDSTTADAVSETGNGSVHGWEDALADDTSYSDGSAHAGSVGATATFTFTGTGVDIYSYTDMTTGTVTANLYEGNAVSKAKIKKALVVDNKAASGAYYQVPTLAFGNLNYGTYTVKITVTNAAGNRSTYYLDGIRVYNPINTSGDTVDQTVSSAYGEKELNAVFTEARELINNSTASFVAYIDEGNNEDGTPTGQSVVESSYSDTESAKLAPEHEIYLAKNQAIVFNTQNADGKTGYYYVGLKAPKGQTSVAISNGETAATATIGHASDLYYAVTPDADGNVVIRNTGDNLLSITKIRATNGGSVTTISNGQAVTTASAFMMRAVVPYEAAAVTEEELPAPETPEVTEPDETEPETPAEEPVEVIIENPEETTQPVEETPNVDVGWFESLIRGVRSLFGRH